MSYRKKGIEMLQRGIDLSKDEKYEEAIHALNPLVDVIDDVCNALVHRGRCHWEMRRWADSLRDFEMALKMAPHSDDIKWTLCLLYLQVNKFNRAWSYVESRWSSKKFDSPNLVTKVPRWTLNSGAKDVLVWSEQGVGDQILYSSLLPAMKDRIEELTVIIDARLIPLLKRSMPEINFIPQNAKVADIDGQIAMGSVPSEFIRSIHDIETHAAQYYISPDKELSRKIRDRYANGGLLVGLSWRSGAPRLGHHKSCPVEKFSPILDIEGVNAISLQYGDIEQDKATLEEMGVSIPEGDMTHDFEFQAACIDACDFVVTVSNATAHLAGAIGTRTFLLDSNKLWYWNNRIGGRSMWYPNVSVFPKENALADWGPQIESIALSIDSSVPPIIVFFHASDEVYCAQAMVDSIRENMAHAIVYMLSDESTPEIEGIDVRKNLDIDRSKIMIERVKAFSELELDMPAIYVDSDMIFVDEVFPERLVGNEDSPVLCQRSFWNDKLFNRFQRGIDYEEHDGKRLFDVYPYLACFTACRGPEFWRSLLEIMSQELDPKYHVWYGDQEAMRIYSERYPIRSVHESEYACLPEVINPISHAKIIHYKGARKNRMQKGEI